MYSKIYFYKNKHPKNKTKYGAIYNNYPDPRDPTYLPAYWPILVNE